MKSSTIRRGGVTFRYNLKSDLQFFNKELLFINLFTSILKDVN